MYPRVKQNWPVLRAPEAMGREKSFGTGIVLIAEGDGRKIARYARFGRARIAHTRRDKCRVNDQRCAESPKATTEISPESVMSPVAIHRRSRAMRRHDGIRPEKIQALGNLLPESG